MNKIFLSVCLTALIATTVYAATATITVSISACVSLCRDILYILPLCISGPLTSVNAALIITVCGLLGVIAIVPVVGCPLSVLVGALLIPLSAYLGVVVVTDAQLIDICVAAAANIGAIVID